MLRRFSSSVGALLVLACLGIAAPASVAVAAPITLDLQMVDGGGTLALRGGEPYAIATPTSITGISDDASGALSGLTFSTPDIEIERQITDPLPADVRIDASFRQLSPGVGTITSDGDVVVQLAMAVDLDVEVYPQGSNVPLPLNGDCHAEPIQLLLESDGPYDAVSESVTLVAEDFTFPPVPAEAQCDPTIAGGINRELAGSGHSLSLSLTGPMTAPPPPGCDTTTDLVATPAGSTARGDALTLTSTVATVADDPECIAAAEDGDVLAGAVDFYRGTSLIGSGDLDGSGVATFTTTSLAAGRHTLTARYRAISPFNISISDPVSHRVTVDPFISADLPRYITIGQPAPFEITVTNPGSGFGGNLRDVAISANFFGSCDNVGLERFDGQSWQEVAVFGCNSFRLPAFDLSSNALPHTERLRVLTDASASRAESMSVTFELVPSSAPLTSPPTPGAITTSGATTSLITGERVPATFTHYAQPIDPHTVRQGMMLSVPGFEVGPGGGPTSDGTLEFMIDGEAVPASTRDTARPGGYVLATPLSTGQVQGVTIPLSPDLSTGEHQLTVRYSGDAFRLPHDETYTFTVVPARGPSYDCFGEGFPPFALRANISAQANLPRASEPGTISLDDLDITLYTDRSMETVYGPLVNAFELFEGTTNVGERGLRGVSFTVNGQPGTATGVTLINPYPLDDQPRPAPAPDQVLDLEGEAGNAAIVGVPGDFVPITLDSITLDFGQFGFNYNGICRPVAEPATLGEVLVAGVDLQVTPPTGAREGSEVTLTASTGNPTDAGVMELLDGTETIGVVDVAGGVASMTTTDLAAGAHTLRARFYAQPAAPVVTSPEVPLTVLAEFDCGEFTDDGAGRTVRLVYMSLLERCPDQAGYDYWVEQLEGGTTQQAFANTISDTHEARRVVANDGYQTMLDRDGSDADLDFWARYLETRPYRRLLAAMGDAPEFRALAGSTDVGFVTRTYQRLLERDPEPAGLEYWVSKLRAGEPDHVLLNTFAGLREPAEQIVIQSYQEILDRDPTPTELDTQADTFQRNGDRSALYGRLIGTGEFVVRADTLPNFPPAT